MGAFGIASLFVRPLAGVYSDTWGRRRVMIIGTVSLVAGAVAVSLTTNAALLFGLRILQATGYVAFTTAATALISDLAPPERRGSAMALFGTAANVSMTTTPALVNSILDKIQFNGAFMLSGALAVISLAMALLVRQEKASENRRFEWTDLINVAKTLRTPLAASALFGIAFGAFFQFLPLLTERRGIGPAGLVFTVYGASLIMTRLITATGRLLDRYNQGWILFISFLLLATGLCGFAYVNEQWALYPISFVFAVGAGTLHPLLIAIHVGKVSDNQRGRASAVFYFGFDLGIGMGAWIYSPIFQGFGMIGLYLLAAMVALFGLIPAWSMTRFSTTGHEEDR
jgi:predicted MFS family arabinose efflux permease